MEKANEKLNDSTFNKNQCKGISGTFFAAPAAPDSVTSCKAVGELDCHCAKLDRLEADLAIHNCTPKSIPVQQVAEDITPAEAAAIIDAGRGNRSVVILDVSTGSEYRKWHIRNAININIFSLKFSEKLNKLDKEKVYLVYCKMGGRSAAAQKVMIKQGFQKVFNIVGGRDRWRMEKLPYGIGENSHTEARPCPVLKAVHSVSRLRTRVKGKLGFSRSTGQIVNH